MDMAVATDLANVDVGGPCELKLLVSPLITPRIISYIIPI